MITEKSRSISPLIPFLSLLLASAACSTSDDEEGKIDFRTSALEQKIIATSNGFGFELFQEVLATNVEDNPFISPFSVSMALGMAYQGAAGETASQMKETLGFGDLTDEEIASSYEHIMEILTNLDDQVTVELANSLWLDDSYTFKPEYLQQCEEYFEAEVDTVDYSDGEAAAATINSWVDANTNGKIPEIVAPPFDNVVMYLINALYFKGNWTFRFDKEDTRDDVFTLEDGTEKQVKMMQLHGEVPFQRNADYLAVNLPYGKGKYAMALMLPPKGTSVDALAASLADTPWDGIVSKFETSEKTVRLPRFELEYKTDLKDPLMAMGMVDAFTAANFSSISESTQMWIGKVLHKTFVSVNEQGTEAAAVTAVEMDNSGEPNPDTLPYFNRPFLVVIHDLTTETILFIGKAGNP